MYEELKKLVPCRRKNPLERSVVDWPTLYSLFPILTKLKDTQQSPIFHAEGNVLVHTWMVVDELLTIEDWSKADDESRFVMFYAALLHDIGKHLCTKFELGEWTSKGHSAVGAIDARILLWKYGVPYGIRERICNIIANHQRPFFVFDGTRDGNGPEFIANKLSHELCNKELAAVAEADMRGRRILEGAIDLSGIDLFRELAIENGCYETPKAFPNAHTKVKYFRSSNNQYSPDFEIFGNPGSKVVVLSGIPASGKDTWCREHANDGRPVISFDDTIAELGLKHGGNVGKAIHLATDRAKELLRKREPFIWNATHLSKQMRQKTLDLLFNYDAEVSIVYIEVAESDVKSRNTKRDTTLRNADIDKMLLKWEPPVSHEAHRVVTFIDDRYTQL